MKLRRPLTCLAVLSVALPSVLSGQKIVVEQTVASGDTPGYVTPWQKLEAVAKLENPADANSVRAVIEAVLDYPYFFGQIPPIMREIVEQRLVQAEISYRLGRNPGIREESLVQIANTLADKFQLPDYAHATLHQVEVLRFGMELAMPSFMGTSLRNEDKSVSPGTSDLSPAQAAHIFLVLAGAKVIDPDYQLTPDEWERTQYKPAMDRLLKYEELKKSGESTRLEHRAVLVTRALDMDLRSTLFHAVSQMSLTDGLDLVEQAFRIAGTSK